MGDSELKKAGLKTTLPRIRILRLMEEGDERHRTAEELYRDLQESGEDVSLATVYRVLTQFEHAGLVIRHNFEGGRAVFELNNEDHHDHLVCLECGRVFEFIDPAIEERQVRVARKLGFSLEGHSMHLTGVCEGMRKHGSCSRD
ncbi:MAG: ferric iron uptake transcriptional regulator [Gammaproteobacteria bacterium]|nr:ferric iron uptake transcriptional regulator [Gammaproteobacteria bacterium]